MPSYGLATARRSTRWSSRNPGITSYSGLGRSRGLASWWILAASGWLTGGRSWRWQCPRDLGVLCLRKPQARRERRKRVVQLGSPVSEKRVVEPRLRIERHVGPLDLEQVEQGAQPR